MQQWERKFEKLEEKLDSRFEQLSQELSTIKDSLQELAVQNERIGSLEAEQRELRNSLVLLTKPNGIIADMRQFQASCPRDKIKSVQRHLMGLTIALVTGLLGVLGKLMLAVYGGH